MNICGKIFEGITGGHGHLRKKLMRDMRDGWWSTFPGIAVLVLFFGEQSFGAQGGLQEPVFREKAYAVILGAVPLFFRDFTCHDSRGVG